MKAPKGEYGWVFWNPDTGEEYSQNHPIRSGECEDAERIRSATAQEQILWKALQEQFDKARAVPDLAMMLRRFIWQADKSVGENSFKVLAGNAKQLLMRHGLEGAPLRERNGG